MSYQFPIRRARVVAGTLAAAAFTLGLALPAWAGKTTCLTGKNPEVANDGPQLQSTLAAIDSTCPCATFDGSAKGKKHGDYIKCAKGVITSRVNALQLRKQCKGVAIKDETKSTCGFAAGTKQVCDQKTLKNGKVACSIKAAGKCLTTTKIASEVCGLPRCIDASDTNGDSLIAAPGDSGLCNPVCGNGVVEVPEQCDHGANNGAPGDTCSASCERLDDTCTAVISGPGVPAHSQRVVKVSIDTPTPLGGVQIDMDYPQFEAGIPGIGSSSVVQNRLNVLQPIALSGLNDRGVDASIVLVGNNPGGINTGDLFTVTFDNCVALNENICNRSQNVFDCCNNPSDPTQFIQGQTHCAQNACATFTSHPACTDDSNCNNIAGDCQAGHCATFSNAPACTTDAQCNNIAGDCSPLDCSSTVPDCQGAGPKGQPQYGNCVFICPGNPPVCSPGHFPASTVGTCDGTASGPNGGCPGDNACTSQASTHTCQVASPTDTSGQPVSGVTCSLTITEQ